MFSSEPSKEVTRLDFLRLQEKVELLEAQVQRLHELLVEKDLEIETLAQRLPKTWLLDPNYWKRAFTAYAYVTVAGFVIGLPVFCITLILALLLGGYQP